MRKFYTPVRSVCFVCFLLFFSAMRGWALPPSVADTIPVAVDDTLTVPKNSITVFNPTLNDTFTAPLTSLLIAQAPGNGDLGFTTMDSLIYKPNIDFCGADSFTYVICNADLVCDTATVYITVDCNQLGAFPIAMDDTMTIGANQLIYLDIAANDNLNGFLKEIKIVSLLKGTAELFFNTIKYTPPTDYCGITDTFSYAVCNAAGCDTAHVAINILCDTVIIKTPPIALDDTYSMDTSTYVTTFFVTENDTLFSKNIDTLIVIKHPTNGTASNINLYQDRIAYMPGKTCGFVDTIEYVICNVDGCDTASVFVNVACLEPVVMPKASSDTAKVNYGGMVMVDVIINDTFNQKDTFRVIVNPTHGIANFDESNMLYYRSDSLYCGRDSLVYEICNRAGCSTASIAIDIACPNPENIAPTAVIDYAETMINKAVIVPIFNNDKRRNADMAEITLQPTRGSVAPSPTARLDFVYLPDIETWGKDSFRYRICNDYGCDSAMVYIYINPGDSIVVYSGFTPNGDDINDRFLIRGIDAYPNNEITIFNRYGNQVFYKKGYNSNEAWDGRWHGTALPVGTYFYVIYLNDERKQHITGYIQLHR